MTMVNIVILTHISRKFTLNIWILNTFPRGTYCFFCWCITNFFPIYEKFTYRTNYVFPCTRSYFSTVSYKNLYYDKRFILSTIWVFRMYSDSDVLFRTKRIELVICLRIFIVYKKKSTSKIIMQIQGCMHKTFWPLWF